MIPTQARLPELTVLLKGNLPFEEMPNLRALVPFDPAVVSCLAALSEALRKRPEATAYPDIMAFAFFIRQAQLKKFTEDYSDLQARALGRGVTFHIAPSNVPLNFAYSLVVGLLSGNACIVRVSEKEFPQVPIVCETLRTLLQRPEHRAVADYIAIVRYGHEPRWNSFFSGLCDVRITWGGDRTVSELRQAQLPPRSYEMVFADRYSALVIQAEQYLKTVDKARIASLFYNDTYYFDQAACSSPRLVYWVGNPEEVHAAQAQFWEETIRTVERKHYPSEPLHAVGKYLTTCRAAIDTGAVKRVPTADNRVVRIALSTLEVDLPKYDCLGGVFFEYVASSLEPLARVLTRKFQTLSYLGIDASELRRALLRQGVSGVDRIVPVGDAGNFSLVWDGYDVIRHLSRVMTIQ